MVKRQSFPAQPEALSQIREFVRALGSESGCADDVLVDILLAVSEACANAMRHSASERLEVLWTPLIDGVAIEIRDEGVFRRQAYPAQAEGGFGIQVMLGLMDELTICGGREDSPGTLVRLVKRAHEPCLVSYPA